MDCEINSEGPSKVASEPMASEVQDRYKVSVDNGDIDGSSQQKVDCGVGTPEHELSYGFGAPPLYSFGYGAFDCGIGPSRIPNQHEDQKDSEEPILIVTPEGQRRS